MRNGRDQSGRGTTDQTWCVVDDFPDVVPVTAQELDVVEAFLMTQFHAVMAGESPANAGVSPAPDSELPQSHVVMRPSVKGRGDGR